MLKSGLQCVSQLGTVSLRRVRWTRNIMQLARGSYADANASTMVSIMNLKEMHPFMGARSSAYIGDVQNVRKSSESNIINMIVKEIRDVQEGSKQDNSDSNGMLLDSVLRKRRKKMKKHKLRKRRRKERAEKRKLGK